MIASVKRLAARRSAKAEVEFKRELVEARHAAGLSQRDLAKLLGVDNSTVSRMERYDSDPRLSDIRKYLTQCKAALEIRVVHTSEIEAAHRQTSGSMAVVNAPLFDAEDEVDDSVAAPLRFRR